MGLPSREGAPVSSALRSLLDFAARDREVRPSVEEAAREGGRRVLLAGLNPAAAAVLVAGLVDRSPAGKILLLVPGEKEAEQFRADLAFASAPWQGGAARVHLFPSL